MRLFPYPTPLGEISLDIDRAWLDDVDLPPSKINRDDRVIALNKVERAAWGTARLKIRLTAPGRELNDGPWTDLRCVAILIDRQTLLRDVSVLDRESDDSWVGEVLVHRDLHFKKATLTAQLVATCDGIQGRLIATAEETWTLDLEASVAERPRLIHQVWADFTDERRPHLHPFKGDPWTIDASGAQPIVYLNRGFEGLEALLTSGRVEDRMIRDVATAQLGAEIWNMLFHIAIQDLHKSGDRREWTQEWHEQVVEEMLPDVFPDRSPETALAELAARNMSASGAADLHRRVLRAALKRAQLPRVLGEQIRAQLRSGEED
ncbi:hypothetical protein [Actinocorallia libanotica]|uniref:Uncharacterized protein n=1 Tax=Actinocorallia libanotica TaxID=46162 RepID=A0ABP4BRC4_9ACTN